MLYNLGYFIYKVRQNNTNTITYSAFRKRRITALVFALILVLGLSIIS